MTQQKLCAWVMMSQVNILVLNKILEQAAALFASGTMNNEDKTTFMDEMTRLYLASKKNRRKW